MTLLPLAFVALLVCITIYVVVRRQRHGGLAGGSATAFPTRKASTMNFPRAYSAEEVAAHSTLDDLWLIINRKVYDFTEYFPLHPGGEAMLRNAGADSTSGFSGSQHPARVWDMVRSTFTIIKCTSHFHGLYP